jgi:hypothetical protein
MMPTKLKLDKTILKKKIAGIPVPIVAAGAGVVGIIAYRHFAGGGASGSASNASGAGPDTSGQSPADYSGGTGDSGQVASGGGGGYGDPASFEGYTGGPFVPAATMGTAQQPIVQIAKWIPKWKPTWTPKWKPPGSRPRRRPLVVNKIVINNRGGIAPKKVGGLRPGQTPPIINRGQSSKTGTGRPIGATPYQRSTPNVRRRRGESPPILRRPH